MFTYYTTWHQELTSCIFTYVYTCIYSCNTLSIYIYIFIMNEKASKDILRFLSSKWLMSQYLRDLSMGEIEEIFFL